MKKHSSKKRPRTTTPPKPRIDYAPFWSRALAFGTDIFMIGLPITLLTMALFGYDQMHTASGLDVIVNAPKAHTNPPNPIASIVQISLFLITYVWLWHKSGQTPGKKLASIRVIDAKTFGNAPYWKLTLRFIGYFISLITLIGFFIGLLRKDKRSLHDLISGTAVIRVS
ncbi:MAG: RDD family protein [Sulfuricurvum sp.]|uniref:RDD family protein n=1 Tax=Sulfuricurvum sp. TaxID=2025608 RepID=UPI0026370913|nr:RDD family protein [Sulfuricurvum sp.]MDD2828354.1 RDD family protein [Sulfuricurvum sp.]MDD4949359.1 RDD family protein [Sulfuricurvum sp.]